MSPKNSELFLSEKPRERAADTSDIKNINLQMFEKVEGAWVWIVWGLACVRIVDILWLIWIQVGCTISQEVNSRVCLTGPSGMLLLRVASGDANVIVLNRIRLGLWEPNWSTWVKEPIDSTFNPEISYYLKCGIRIDKDTFGSNSHRLSATPIWVYANCYAALAFSSVGYVLVTPNTRWLLNACTIFYGKDQML